MLTSSYSALICSPATTAAASTRHHDPDRHPREPLPCDDLLFWGEEQHCSSSPASPPKGGRPPSKREATMERPVEPDEDFRVLHSNDLKLRLCGYYWGSLSWLDAAHALRRSAPGTFLVRDSEHHSYLYALSVQTPKGPTSCRIEYVNGRFRLDASDDLADKMPRFEGVPDLVEHYVRLTQNLPKRSNMAPVWLDMDQGGGGADVPVQIYRPLYRTVRGLQHLCRVALVRLQKQRYPSSPLSRTIDEREYRVLPTVLKDYLKEYPYSQ